MIIFVFSVFITRTLSIWNCITYLGADGNLEFGNDIGYHEDDSEDCITIADKFQEFNQSSINTLPGKLVSGGHRSGIIGCLVSENVLKILWQRKPQVRRLTTRLIPKLPMNGAEL